VHSPNIVLGDCWPHKYDLCGLFAWYVPLHPIHELTLYFTFF
jgi:hypothetical protein